MLSIFLSLVEEKSNKSDVTIGFGKVCKVSKRLGIKEPCVVKIEEFKLSHWPFLCGFSN